MGKKKQKQPVCGWIEHTILTKNSYVPNYTAEDKKQEGMKHNNQKPTPFRPVCHVKQQRTIS
jgi:hypothetical protein